MSNHSGEGADSSWQKSRWFRWSVLGSFIAALGALAELSGFNLRELRGIWNPPAAAILTAESRSALRAQMRKLASDGALSVDEAQELTAYVAGLKVEAQAAQRYLAEIEPGIVQAARGLQEGIDLASQNRFREARARFREATRLDGESALAWANFGSAALELGAMTEAEAALRKALTLEPESIEANYNFGACLAAKNDQSALDYLERALNPLLRGDSPRSFDRRILLDDLQSSEHFSSLRGSDRYRALIQRIKDELP